MDFTKIDSQRDLGHYRVLPNSTVTFREKTLGSMETTNHHRTCGRKLNLVGAIRKTNYEECDVEWIEKRRYERYWVRTRDKASHDPIPIPLGYRGHSLESKEGRKALLQAQNEVYEEEEGLLYGAGITD
ncbi:hypothetical protein TNCV_295191 [Trichonephila clavipes]|nr:hypothetical protein TNCV_295191 [Trichonephila clavipes]